MRPFLTLHDPATARRHYAAGLWQNDTFYTLLAKNTERAPEALALCDAQTRLDWSSLKARVDAMADDFIERGFVAGDRLSIWMSNRVDVITAFLACSREGLACNPSLHRSYTCAEILQLLDRLRPRALLTEPGWGVDRATQDFDAMLKPLDYLRKVYTPQNLPAHITQLDRVPDGNPDRVAYLAFTSGTTGQPKCVMHSANTLLANARDLASDWKLDASCVLLTLSPLSHHIAWVAVGQWLVSGGRLVTGDPPKDMTPLDWIIESGTTYVMGVPTHAMDLLAEQKRRGLERLGQVKTFYMAGAPIPDTVAKAFVEMGIIPQNVYGMTENSSHAYTHPEDSPETWVSTCGRGGAGYRVKIWDPEDPDRELPPGETGEIGGIGATMMLGYYDNQSATEKTMNAHGYLMSGDLGALDAAGNLRILGRLKDLIIRGGHNIYPSRIEACAHSHPAVGKAAAFPIPDERLGEKVCLAITGDLGPNEMLDHLAAAGLSRADMPEWYLPRAALPLTPSGKILKRELTEMAKRGEISPMPVRYVPKKDPSA